MLFIVNSLAAIGDVEGLETWQIAGVDMDQRSYDGQNPLQVVSKYVELYFDRD